MENVSDVKNSLKNSPSSDLLIDQEASSRESEQSSSGGLWAMVKATLETCLIIAGLVQSTLQLHHLVIYDGRLRYDDLVSLFTTHSLYQPHSRYSLVGPLFSSPLLWIGMRLGHPYLVAYYNVAIFSLFLLTSYFLLRNYVDRTLLRKFFLVLVYSSMFVAHLSFYYGEVFTALCVGFGVFIALRRPPGIGGWVAVILGVINTPATLVGLGLLILKRVFDSKRLRYLLVFVAAMLGFFMECWIRRGNIFNNGYIGTHGSKTVMPYSGLPDFSYPFFFGLLSTLFSFGDGLLFYIPGLLLPIRKTLSQWPQDQKIDLYQVYTLWIYFVIGMLLIYSRWWAWNGWVFWGPRFFLFACIPASFALAVRLIRYKEASLGLNLLTFIVFCLSVWICIDGTVFQWVSILGTDRLQWLVTYPTACRFQNPEWQMLCWYTPEYSPLWMPFVFHFPLVSGLKKFLVFFLLVAAYMVAPLFIYMLRQIWDLTKKLSKKYLNLKRWRI